MNSQKQTFRKKCMAIFLSVAVIFSGINPVMIAQADTAADAGETITVTINVAPSTVNATFYEGEDGKIALDTAKVTDKGIVDKYHQYELKVEKGRYSYRGVDSLGTEDAADDINLGGMAFDVPIHEEIMEDGSASGEGQLLTLRRSNFYTTNANITKVGDYSLQLYPAGLPIAVNGDQYMGTIGSNATERVITPVLTMARGNALTYQGTITLTEALSADYGVANIVNYTIGAGTSINNKTFSLATLINRTITAPKEAKVQMFNQINNFNVEEIQQTGETDNGDGTATHHYKVIGANLTYRVSMKDKITRAGFFGNKTEDIVVTYEEDENPNVTGHALDNATIQRRMEASTLVNVNGQNNLNLATGDTFRLRAYRGAWQIINTDTANIMIEPDFHYNVISGDEHIEMTPAANKCTGNAGTGDATNWMDIKGVSAGTAIVEVSYDAIQIGGDGTSYDGLYGATDPQRKSLIVINVGETGNTLKMQAANSANLWDTEYDTAYFTGETGTLDFTATLGEATPDKVELSTDKGVSWKPVNAAEGVYHAEGLVGGNNILRFTKGDKVEYQVVRAAKVSFTLTNASRNSEEIIAGDDVNITFKGLYTPISKFSGIYNPGYGQGHKVAYTLPEGVTAVGSGGQYDFISTNTYTVTTAGAGTVTLTGGHVLFNNMGVDDPIGGHRTLTDAGCGTNMSAVSTMHTRGVLPDISFDVVEMPYTPVTVTADEEGTAITITNEAGETLIGEGNVYTLPYGTYQYVAAKEGYVTERGSFTVEKADYLQGKKTVFIDMRKVEGAIWDGQSVTEPKLVDGVYQIGTGAELAWFAENANGTAYNAVLTDDVSLGGFNWTPIASKSPWKGTFDGQGHYVTDLYIDSTSNNVALFGYASTDAVIKNLGVKGEVTTTGKYAAGIVTAKATTVAFTVENCKSEVNVTANSIAGGVVANQGTKVTVKNCYNAGTIRETQTKTTTAAAGGVSCATSQTTKVVLENCYNTGRILGVGKHGSVVYVNNTSNAANVKNCYGLAGTCNTKTIAGIDVSKAELKELALTLGDAYMVNPTSYNGGYPILTWEEPKALAVAKAEFPVYLAGYKNPADYRSEEAEILENVLNTAKAAIEAAETLADVEKVFTDAKATMDQLKTGAEYVAAELEAAKQTAKEEIAVYKNAEDYRDAEKTELADAIEAAKQAIDAAIDIEDVNTAVETAKSAMDDIKTDAQLAAEELDAAKQAAKEEITVYKNAEDYRDAEKIELADAMEAAKQAINAATDIEGVNIAVTNAKAAMDTIKTDFDYVVEEAATLAEAKELAKDDIADYKNLEHYRDAQQEELKAVIEDAQQAIDAATDISSVADALEAAKGKLDAVKTANQMAEEDISGLQQQITTLQAALNEAEKANAEVKAALEKQIADLEEALKTADAVDKEALQKEIAVLETALKDAETAMETSQKELQEQIVQLQKDLADAQMLTEKQKEEFAAEIRSLQEALEDAKTEITVEKKALEERIAELEERLATEQSEKEILKQQIEALEQAVKNAENLNAADKKVMEDEIARLKEALKIAEDLTAADKKAMEAEITALKETLKNAENANAADKAALNEMIAKLQQALKDTETTNAADKIALNEQIVALEQALEDTKSLGAEDKRIMEAEITALKELLQNAEKENDSEKDALEKEIAALKAELEKLTEDKQLAAPTKVKAQNVAKTGKIKVTWKAVKGADEYVVYRAKSKDGAYKKMFTTTGTRYTNTSAVVGKTYYYKVKAVSDDKDVDNSKLSKAVKRTCDLKRPVVTAKSKTKKQVKLTWKKVEGAKKYVVYRATSPNGKYKKVGTTTKLTYTNKKLKSGKTYYYKIKAVAKNSAANSAFSVVDKCKVR